MTIIDLDDKVEKWFEMEGGGRVQLRLLSADDFKEIDKQTVKKKVEYRKVDGTPARFDVEASDTELRNHLFWDRAIVAWENIFDRNEAEIPCTSENKILLMSKSIKFAEFVADGFRVMREDGIKRTEESEKN